MIKKLPKHKDTLSARLAGYAATAGAMMALAPNVNGQVVYSGLQNIQLDMPFDTVGIDMNDDAIPDFNFLIYGYSYAATYSQYYYRAAFGYAVIMNPKTDSYKNSWITRMTSTFSSSYTNSQTYYNYNPVPIVEGLDPGLPVDGSASLWSNISYPQFPGALGIGTIYYTIGPDETYSYSRGYGDFLSESRFIGVRFYIGSDQHYGWIRVRLGEYIDPLTIIDWAYELTPELGI